ncbi:MAG: glycoside hydrolase family 3 C-terminal domain-containing protein [Bryobacteraceae bacterium]
MVLLHQQCTILSDRKFHKCFAVAAPMALICICATFATAQTAPTVTGNPRVDKLLSQMTLEEKIAMVHGTGEDPSTNQGQAGYLAGIPRLGIPSLRLADGPPGVLTRVPSTAPTATMGLAATFSREDAKQNGILVAREARAHGIDVVLQPFINIDRDVMYGRGYNTYGEDPLLTGQIGAAFIRGVQGQGVMAQAKHYVGYDTDGTNVFVDQQTLHEIYAAPFADAAEAEVSSIMCSYNKVNGPYSCGNSQTLNGILKKEIGFKGFVTSDWGATHATDFINAGLDLEMPGPLPVSWNGPSYFENGTPVSPGPPDPEDAEDATRDGLPEEPAGPPWVSQPEPKPATNLRKEVQDGLVTEATITVAAGRVLNQMDKFGLLDGKSKHGVTPSAVAENARIVQKTGEDAAVLLKNEGESLPLKKSDLQSLVLIGPGAGQTIAVGMTGEKAVGLPEREIGTLEALKRITGSDEGVKLTYAVANDLTGTPVPPEFLSHDGKPGIERISGNGAPAQVDSQIDFTKSNGKALPANSTNKWRGTLTIPATGAYRLHLQVLGCFSNLLVDGKRVARVGLNWIHGDVTQAGQDDIMPTTDGLDNVRIELHLSAGPHAITVSTRPDSSNNPAQVRLNWVTPQQQKANHDAAIATAKRARTAVVFAWSRGRPEFALPGDQDKLIEDVAAVNPNTIVVLNVSQPVAMPWLKNVKAVLQMWWPGDEGGWATANILLGKKNPAGRLPFTWARRFEDMPANNPAYPERTKKGVDGKTTFSEGIYVGYRWFDKEGIDPLFPFGYGLSYAKFEYSGLRVVSADNGGVDVSFQVKNSSKTAGDEVPQVYLGAPGDRPAGAKFAVHALAGFDRITLSPGESRTVSLHLPLRRFQYWSTASKSWITATGLRRMYVGASSRDLRLEAPVTIH